jgi:hypothetical protein
MGPMAAATCGILLVTFLRPGLAASMAVFALSNVFAVYQVAANTGFVERLPNEKRAQAFGLANAGLVVGQGAAFAIAGAAATLVPPSAVVAVSGGLGAAAACGLALSWRRISPGVGRHTARHLKRSTGPARPAIDSRGTAVGRALANPGAGRPGGRGARKVTNEKPRRGGQPPASAVR